MRRAQALSCFAGAALALGAVACAGLVGADFGDEFLGGGVSPGDGSVLPTLDSAPGPGTDTGITLGDAAPVIVADGGACPTGLTDCGGLCVDLTNDPKHCGKCPTACPNDPHGPGVCVASSCAYACETGWSRCSTGCCPLSFPDAAGPDAAPGIDSGPVDPGLACATSYCSIAAQNYCCAGTDAGDLCEGPTNTTFCPWLFYCDNQAECGPGLICCYDNTPGVTESMCQSTCGGQNQYQLCTTSAECTGGTSQCTGNTSALTSGLQTSYSYCQ